MRSTTRVTKRPGYTLLEMVLALGIGVVLIAALYTAFATQIELAKSGRARIDEANKLRAITLLIQADVRGNIGPISPSSTLVPVNPNISSAGSASSATGNSTNGGTSTSTTSTTTQTNNALFNIGVLGNQTSLVLSVSKVPREVTSLIGGDQAGNPQNNPVSDLRLISYWLVGDQGLARDENPKVTDPDVTSILATATDPGTYIQTLAPEKITDYVKNVSFSYFGSFDSSQTPDWQSTWNGLAIDANPANSTAQLPIGPPSAIRVELTMKSAADPDKDIVFQQVIVINAANRWALYSTTNNTSP